MAGSFADALIRIRGDTSDVSRALRRTRDQLRGLSSPLRRIRDIAGGILLARAFQAGWQAVQRFAGMAIKATETMQLLDLQIQSLAAREMAQFINNAVEMSGAITYTTKGTENWYIINEALRKNLGEYVDLLPQISQELNEVAESTRHGTRVAKEQGVAWVSASNIYELAADRADRIGFQLKKIGVLSPYSIQAANDVMRLSLAFGFTTDQSLRMTQGMLDVAAGLGATTEQLNRMTFNFAQLRKQGKMQARDFWELGKAGFDLYAVLRKLSSITGLNIKNHHDFNRAMASGKITWEDFVTAFETMADEDFGGAAKRMAYSITGIKSMFKDVFLVTIPEILKPTAELIGKYAEKMSEKLLLLIEGGELEVMGERLRDRLVELFEDIGGAIRIAKHAGDQPLVALLAILRKLGLISGETQTELTPLAVALMGLWTAAKDLAGIAWETVSEGISGFIQAFMGEDDIGEGLVGIIKGLGEGLASIATVLSEHKDAIVTALTDLGPPLRDLADALGQLGGALGEIAVGVLENIFAIFSTGGESATGAEKLASVTDVITGLGDALKTHKDPIVDGLTAILLVLGGFKVLTFLAGVAGAVVAFVGAISWPIVAIGALIAGLVALVLNNKEHFLNAWNAIRTGVVNAVTGAWEALKNLAKIILFKLGETAVNIETWANNLPEKLEAAWTKLKANARNSWDSIRLTIIGKVNTLKGQIQRKIASIAEDFRGKWDEIKQAGKDIIQGFLTGLQEKWDEVKAWILDVAAKLPAWLKDLLGIASPSKVFEGIGADAMAGFVEGIAGAVGQVQTAVGDVAVAATATPGVTSSVGQAGTMTTDRSKNITIAPGAISVTVGKEQDIFAATMAFEDALLNTLEDV